MEAGLWVVFGSGFTAALVLGYQIGRAATVERRVSDAAADEPKALAPAHPYAHFALDEAGSLFETYRKLSKLAAPGLAAFECSQCKGQRLLGHPVQSAQRVAWHGQGMTQAFFTSSLLPVIPVSCGDCGNMMEFSFPHVYERVQKLQGGAPV